MDQETISKLVENLSALSQQWKHNIKELELLKHRSEQFQVLTSPVLNSLFRIYLLHEILVTFQD